MLTPLLLNLYNAAVRSLPDERKAMERRFVEEIDAVFKAAGNRLDRIVNAIELRDTKSIEEQLKGALGGGSHLTEDERAFLHAVQEAFFPAPEGVAVSPILTHGDLSQLMESLPPADGAHGMTLAVDAPLLAAPTTTEIPPQSPPAEAPAPAVAEPIPAPAVTPAEPGRAKPPKSSRR